VVVPQPLLPPPAPARVSLPIPTIVPLLLQAKPADDGSGSPGPQVKLQMPDGKPVRIPSVLVIPGGVGYLKSFFSARLYVANGAPLGSGLVVHDVTGTIKRPAGEDAEVGTDDDPLSLPTTDRGPQPETMAVVGVGPDGKPGTGDDVRSFGPGEEGQAEF